MNDIVKVRCENNSTELYVDWGSTLRNVASMLSLQNQHPFLAAYVNNFIKQLDFKIYEPVSVRFVDITHFEGMRVYQRTLFMVLHKAVHDLYPEHTLCIRHSVSRGFYADIESLQVTQAVVENIKHRVKELIDENIPIVRNKYSIDEAIETYRRLGFDDKLTLIESRPHLYYTIYKLADMAGYFFGALAPSTGAIHLFDLKPYYKGIYISVPQREQPDRLEQEIPQDKMFEIFNEYKNWVRVMGVSNVGMLNSKINAGDQGMLIKTAEAFHEKKLARIADTIAEANGGRGARLVLIAGPSSSGKTTFAKRLGIQLRVVGLEPVMISLDDYFVDRDQTPRDENGEYDYETIEALDLKTFNDNLKTLFDGGEVDIPRYDFVSGQRKWHEHPLKLSNNSVLVVEGIHGLNPHLTNEIADNLKFRIYISCLTSLSLDNMSRIPTTDNRLIRRIVRDNATRGSNALKTLQRWASVRRGEDKHIFPYQENADIMFNSSLFYELPVLKRYAEPLLHQVPDTEPEYGEAKRLLKFLDNFQEIAPDQIPPTSILREFIGGSSFTY